jgi:cell division protein FtsI/penicillin-binding protein 2
MNKRITGILLCVLQSISFFAFAAEKISLDAACRAFETEKGECGVLVIEMRNAKIEYMYNETIIAERRFPPGSCAKPLAAALMLDHQTSSFSAETPVRCSGRYYPPQSSAFTSNDFASYNIQKDAESYFKCSLRDGHGLVGLPQALSESCNVFFLTKASQWNNFYSEFIDAWALLSDPVQKIKHRDDAVTPFQCSAAAIGEGSFRISPLKLAQCYSALFTGSPLLIPSRDGSAHTTGDVAVSRRSRERISAILSDVVRNGTLRDIDVKRKDLRIIAAKTGTATHFGKKLARHGWNVVEFEYNNKKMLLVTFTMNGSGSKEAARLSEIILNSWKNT